MMMRSHIAVAGAALSLVMMTGCAQDATPSASPPVVDSSATPSASPTAPVVAADEVPAPNLVRSQDRLPAREDLVVSPEGIGSLRVGRSVAETDMVVFRPDYCIEIMMGFYPSDADPDRWVPHDQYGSIDQYGSMPFSVWVDESGIVKMIDLYDSTLTTAGGIGRHVSTQAEVRSIYPDLKIGADGYGSTMEYVSTPRGNLGFEIATKSRPDSWDVGTPGAVVNIRITAPDIIPTPWAGTEADAGGCL
jgi:hypothetical protein